MFEKVSQFAEQVATRASRRAFLGKVGQGTLALAGLLGGFLAFPTEAKADPRCPGQKICNHGNFFACCPKSSRCCVCDFGPPIGTFACCC